MSAAIGGGTISFSCESVRREMSFHSEGELEEEEEEEDEEEEEEEDLSWIAWFLRFPARAWMCEVERGFIGLSHSRVRWPDIAASGYIFRATFETYKNLSLPARRGRIQPVRTKGGASSEPAAHRLFIPRVPRDSPRSRASLCVSGMLVRDALARASACVWK